MSAGNDLEQSVAMIAAANRVLQDPSQVGSALRTISLRIRGTSVKELEALGEETDGAVESVSKLQEKIKGLTGIDILTDAGDYKSTYEVLKEIAEVWPTLSDMSRAGALELLAGKNRSNAVAAILTNIEDLEGAYEKAMQAEGSAMAENEKYLDSIQGRIDQFNNAFQTMWNDELGSGIIKAFIGIGTEAVKLIDKLGLLQTIVLGFAAIKFGKILFKGFKFSDIIKEISSLTMGMNIFKKGAIASTLASTGQTAANGLLATSFKVLALDIWGAVKAIGAFLLTNPVGWAILATGAIVGIIAAINHFTVSFEEAKEQLEKTSEELETVQSEIESLNNELKTTSDRIDELNAKDKLTIVEEEELKALRAQNDELKAQIELEKQREQILKNQQAKDALAAYERDESFKTISYIETDSTGAATGDFVELAPEVDRYLEDRRKNTEALTKANKELEKAQKDLLNTGGKDTRSGWEKFWGLKSDEQKAVDDAIANVEKYEKAVEDSENNIVSLLKEREELYGDVGFFYGDPKDLTETQKQWNETLTQIKADAHKTYIELDNTGKAASNAFKEISSRQFFSDELENIQNQVGITGEELAGMWANAVPETEDPYGLRAFIQNLIDAGIIADTSVESMQRVVDLSIAMSDGTSDAEKANKRLARSQKRLEYYKLAKELNKYTNNIENLTDAQREEINTIRKKMSALAVEIDGYDLLGDKLSEVKQSFEEFSSAQEADSNSDYTDDISAMLQAVIEGYQSAEMGSEAFKSAFTSLIPESVYKDIDTLQGKYEAAASYIRDTLSNYFNIEYDDDGLVSSIEVTTKNIQNFIEDAEAKGLMTFTDGVWKVNETDFEQFAQKMGITEEMLLAIGEQMDKVDADWITGDLTSFFDSFTMDAETEIYKNIKALAALDEQLLDNKISSDEYASKYKEYTDKIKENTNEIISNINGYNEATKNVDSLTEQLTSAKDKLKELQDSGASESEINLASEDIKRIIGELDIAINQKNELGMPSQIELEFAQDSISAQYEALKAQWTNETITLPVDLNVDPATNQLIKFDEESGEYVISAELEGLSDAEMGLLQEYVDLVNTQGTINVYMDNYEQEAQKVEDLKAVAQETQNILANLDVTVEATEAIKTLNTVKSLADSIKDKTVNVTTYTETVDKGTRKEKWYEALWTFAKGTAYAQGSWRAGVSTNDALVGELGPELRVRDGKYEVLGENGAEFTDVKPNDIIFNAKQTEEIFKNGHISSRGKAYVGGTSGTMYTGGAIAPAFGGEVLNWFPRDNTIQDFGHIIEDATSSADDAKDSFDELIDWFEILTEEIDHQISVMEAQLDNAVGIDQKSSIYAGLAVLEKNKMDAYNKGIALYTKEANKFLSQIPDKYKAMAKDGSVAITEFVGEANEAAVDAINSYRDYIGKVHDLQQQLIETETRISNLRVEKIQMISEEYENQIGLIENLNNKIQSQIDLLEEQSERISANYYNAMIANTEQQIALMNSQRGAMQAEFNNAVASGDVKYASSDWYEMKNAIDAVDASILEAQTSIASFEKSIRDLHWEEFDRIIDRISSVADEAANLRDLLGEDEDMVDEMGDWTKEGIASLGLLAQEMENAEYRAKLYADEIEWLNKNWKKEGYSVDEYNEKLQELKDGQWDSIDAYESAKDAIVDLNKTRVDAIKDGIEKEIDAYQKLIEAQKESLQAQKDEHDWRNTVKDHTTKISDIQRQIDSMAGDTSAAASARRKQLQEELAAAEDEYNETLYDREIEMQQEALDKELEMYRENKEAEMEEWDKYLTQEEKVLQDSFTAVKANAELIHTTLLETATKYGISITSNITEPWKQGQNAIAAYSTEFDNATSNYISQLDSIRQSLINLQNQANITAGALLNTLNQSYTYSGQNTTSGGNTTSRNNYFLPEYPLPTNGGNTGSANSAAGASSVSVGSKVTVDQSATNFTRDGGNGTKMQSWVPGSSFDVMQVSGNEVLIGKNGQVTGWVKKSDLVGYSSGGNSGGGSSGRGSSSGGGSSKTYTGSSSSGGTYTIGSEKGKDFVSKAPAGSKLTGGDGSKWTKNSDGSTTIEKNGKKYTVPKHAKGTMGVKSDELAWIDENGLEEIVMHAQGGKLTYLTKGSAVIPHDISENLIELGKVDPQMWMDKNRPNTIPANIMTQNNHIELSVAKLIHIEHADKDSIPEIQEAVKKQLDSYMKTLNAGIKKYSR